MRSLPDTSHEHHEKIEPHVDRLPELAEMIGHVSPDVFSATFQEECSFIADRLVPHMGAIETTLYGRLEQVMDKRHSMALLRREHEQLRGLFASLCQSITTEFARGLHRDSTGTAEARTIHSSTVGTGTDPERIDEASGGTR